MVRGGLSQGSSPLKRAVAIRSARPLAMRDPTSSWREPSFQLSPQISRVPSATVRAK